MRKAFVDTNILMSFPKELFDTYEKIIISGIVLEELDKHKYSSNENKKYQARLATRIIEENEDKVEFELSEGIYDLPKYFNRDSNDNKILSLAKDLYELNKNIIVLSNDLNFRQKCKCIGVPVSKFESEKNEKIYAGYKEIYMTEEELASHYQNPINQWSLLHNEYLIIKDLKGDIVDRQKWLCNKGFVPISYKQIDNAYLGKIKPKNIHQELAFDLFQNKNITVKVLYGKYGTGKDFIMSSHALNMVQKGVYDKIIFVRNNFGVKNTKELGYLPGDLSDKLTPFAMPLADHVGGIDGLKMFIGQGKVELQHLGFIRGRDIKNSIVYCTEAENMTKEHIQLLISRLAEGSTLWLNGDFKQIDHHIFEFNNGLSHMIKNLSGNELFGCVELNEVERSKTAQLADLMD